MPPAFALSPRRRAGRALALVVASLLVGGACSSGDDGSTTTTEAPLIAAADRTDVSTGDLDPFSFNRQGLAGAGTPLGAGLSVPEGSLLLGVPFPDLVGGGYRALLLVTGEPVEVFNSFDEQGAALGMELEGGCRGVEGELECSGRLVDRADGESLSLALDRRADDTGVVSGLGLRYRPPGSEETGGGGPSTAPPPTAPVLDVALPEGPVPQPDDADVAAAVRAPGSPLRSVELGSRLIGMPGPCACEDTGWSFVVEVDGMIRDVMAAYARQFSDLGDPPDIADRRRDDVALLGLRVGGGEEVAEIRAVAPDVGPAYAIVTVIGS